eukprot:3219738-Prymnesium_polylepis.1
MEPNVRAPPAKKRSSSSWPAFGIRDSGSVDACAPPAMTPLSEARPASRSTAATRSSTGASGAAALLVSITGSPEGDSV